ncbi:MAG: CsbD family protein [Candidatus Methanoperedens sp.]|nr:CsbD family protein [Candidatus Methanoperedens sp.]
MKSSTQDLAEDKIHKVKGEIKENGKLIKNPDMETEGKDEKIAGKVQ